MWNITEREFEKIFKMYHPRLRQYAGRFIHDDAAVCDILQDCFVRLWERRADLEDTSIGSLLFVMTRNACLNYLKHRVIAGMRDYGELVDMEGEERLYHVDFLGDAERQLVYEELLSLLYQVVDTMPQRQREVFRMSRMEGMKYQEIAQKLDISVKAVEKHISAALRTLRERLGTSAMLWLMNALLVAHEIFTD